jgi:hypothetical protein
MGGRGQYVNRGGTVGLTVTTGDGTVFEYRQKGKKVFSFSGASFADSGSREIPRTLSDIASRAKSMGYKVQKLTSRDLANKDSEQRRLKKKIAKEVDQLWVRGAGSPKKGMKGH